MLASSHSEVRAVQNARDLPGMAGFDHELKLAMRRRRTGPAVLTLPPGKAQDCLCINSMELATRLWSLAISPVLLMTASVAVCFAC